MFNILQKRFIYKDVNYSIYLKQEEIGGEI